MTEEEARKVLDFEWDIKFVPSWLCLREKGKKAVVIRVAPKSVLSRGVARIYEGWVKRGGAWEKIYDPRDEYTVGQVLELP